MALLKVRVPNWTMVHEDWETYLRYSMQTRYEPETQQAVLAAVLEAEEQPRLVEEIQ